MDKLFVERSNGRWEAWTYSDGQRIYVMRTYEYSKVESYAKKYHFDLVNVS
jgi:hypothetical protein